MPTQFELVEAYLQNLSVRVADVPATGILMCRLLMHVGREMTTLFERQIRPFGLAEAEFRVLTTLFSLPGGVAHPGDLGARASQSPTNMSRISDALVSRGLITRDLSLKDRRRMELRITEQGDEVVRQLLPKLFAPLRELLKEFPEAEQRQLNDQLKRLGFELEQASAAMIDV
jgi:MarR family transcriptional regulator, negative regulator of the multidrug operon emrRAB